jgi:perosamine synthetase
MVNAGLVRQDQPVKIADVRLAQNEIDAVTEVLRSGALREGQGCALFEQEFAAAVGVRGACTISNGTAALHAAYLGCVGPGDEVLVPAVSFFATASMVAWTGATPVFCDIDADSYCIDVEDARKRITPRTRAIAPVHLFGNVADVDAVLQLAQEHGLAIVWDAAQAHLSRWGERDVGALPGVSCYSFYATKNLTTGEGGMVTSEDDDVIERVRLLKRQGQARKYQHTVLGTNYRMTDMQAVIGSQQLRRLPELTERRRENARRYDALLGELEGVHVPACDARVYHVYHQYTITIDPAVVRRTRDEIVEHLQSMNIQVGINYPIPLHKQPVFASTAQPELPRAEKYSECCLSLPVQPLLEVEQIEYVAAVLRQALGTD